LNGIPLDFYLISSWDYRHAPAWVAKRALNCSMFLLWVLSWNYFQINYGMIKNL
jgi:hypothetical protein